MPNICAKFRVEIRPQSTEYRDIAARNMDVITDGQRTAERTDDPKTKCLSLPIVRSEGIK